MGIFSVSEPPFPTPYLPSPPPPAAVAAACQLLRHVRARAPQTPSHPFPFPANQPRAPASRPGPWHRRRASRGSCSDCGCAGAAATGSAAAGRVPGRRRISRRGWARARHRLRSRGEGRWAGRHGTGGAGCCCSRNAVRALAPRLLRGSTPGRPACRHRGCPGNVRLGLRERWATSSTLGDRLKSWRFGDSLPDLHDATAHSQVSRVERLTGSQGTPTCHGPSHPAMPTERSQSDGRPSKQGRAGPNPVVTV